MGFASMSEDIKEKAGGEVVSIVLQKGSRGKNKKKTSSAPHSTARHNHEPPLEFKEKAFQILLGDGCPSYLAEYYVKWIWDHKWWREPIDQIWREFESQGVRLIIQQLEKGDQVTCEFVQRNLPKAHSANTDPEGEFQISYLLQPLPTITDTTVSLVWLGFFAAINAIQSTSSGSNLPSGLEDRRFGVELKRHNNLAYGFIALAQCTGRFPLRMKCDARGIPKFAKNGMPILEFAEPLNNEMRLLTDRVRAVSWNFVHSLNSYARLIKQ